MIDGITISFAAAIWGWAACWPLSWPRTAVNYLTVMPATSAARAQADRESRPPLAARPTPSTSRSRRSWGRRQVREHDRRHHDQHRGRDLGLGGMLAVVMATHGRQLSDGHAGDASGEGTGRPGKQAAFGRTPNSIYIAEPTVLGPAPGS